MYRVCMGRSAVHGIGGFVGVRSFDGGNSWALELAVCGGQG